MSVSNSRRTGIRRYVAFGVWSVYIQKFNRVVEIHTRMGQEYHVQEDKYVAVPLVCRDSASVSVNPGVVVLHDSIVR